MKISLLKILIIVAGVCQIFTALVYPLVRYRVLHWFEDLKNLTPLNQAIAKTYGFYIQGINLAMGLLSVFLVQELLTPSKLTIAITTFMAVYWIGRISFQLKDYNFSDLKLKRHYSKGIWAMNILIFYLAIIYTVAFIQLIIQL